MQKAILCFLFLFVFYIFGWEIAKTVRPQEPSTEEIYKYGERKLKQGLEYIKGGNDLLSFYTTKERFLEIIGTEEIPFDTFLFYLIPEFKLKRTQFSSISSDDWKNLVENSKKNNKNRLNDFFKEIRNSEIVIRNDEVNTFISKCQDEIEKIRSNYDNGAKSLIEAIFNFDQVIKNNPEFINAYIRKTQAYIGLGLDAEAIKAYESCRKLGFENLTIPINEVKETVFTLAEICNTGVTLEMGDNKPSIICNYNYGLEIVEEFFKKNEERLIKMRNDTDLVDERRIINDIVKNDFEIINYYIRIGRANSAKDEYIRKMSEYSKKIGIYGQSITSNISTLTEDIQNVFLTFDIKLVPNSKKEKHEPEIKLAFLPDFKEGVNDDRETKSGDLIKLSFYYNPDNPMLYRSMISISKRITINENIKNVGITIPKGRFYIKMMISKLAVGSSRVLPLKVRLNNYDLIPSKLTLVARYDSYSKGLNPLSSPVNVELDKRGNIIYNRKTEEKIGYKNIEGHYYKAEAEFAIDIKPNHNELTLKLEKNEIKRNDWTYLIPIGVLMSVILALSVSR